MACVSSAFFENETRCVFSRADHCHHAWSNMKCGLASFKTRRSTVAVSDYTRFAVLGVVADSGQGEMVFSVFIVLGVVDSDDVIVFAFILHFSFFVY